MPKDATVALTRTSSGLRSSRWQAKRMADQHELSGLVASTGGGARLQPKLQPHGGPPVWNERTDARAATFRCPARPDICAPGHR
jgi:hypothetical protein